LPEASPARLALSRAGLARLEQKLAKSGSCSISSDSVAWAAAKKEPQRGLGTGADYSRSPYESNGACDGAK
jgi:hypothetical protein